MGAKLKLAGLTLILGLFVVLFLPTLRWLVHSWAVNPYYTHGFLVPAVSGFLVWRKRKALARPQPHNAGLVLSAVGLAMHLVALPWHIFPLSALAMIIATAGLMVTFYGLDIARRMAFPLAFLTLAIPLPVVERLSPPLEAFIARFATLGVQAVGVAASSFGSQVQLAGSAFVVGAPCSGLRSLVALITLTLLFAYVVQGPWGGKAALLLAAVPIALLANLVRVSSLFLVADTLGADAGLQYYHSLSSPVLFLVAFGLLIMVSRSVRCSEIRTDW